MSFKGLFRRRGELFEFQGSKLAVWDHGYWMAQGPLIGIPYRHYYHRFQEEGWENVPEGKPVLFAISHRNAFMDSLAFVNLHDSQVWQLARGDAFKKPVMRRLFYFFHMLPIWRERDGVDTRSANEPTFQACYDILYHKGMVGIYPEGDCVNERYIRPLKKGICRIAFGAMEKYNWDMELFIVPVGISYSGAEKFKKTQLIRFGKAISVSEYQNLYLDNAGNAINRLKDEIYEGMKDLVVHIPKSDFHHQIDQIAEMAGRASVQQQNKPYTPLNKLLAEQTLVSKLESIRQQNPHLMHQLSQAVQNYKKQMKKFDFRENTFDSGRTSLFQLIATAAVLFLSFPLFLAGFLTHYLPFRLPQWYVRKTVRQRIFYSSLQYAFGLIVFTLYYLLAALIIAIITSNGWQTALIILVLPFTGNFAYYYWREFKRWWSAWKYRRLEQKRKSDLSLLKESRSFIIKHLFEN